MWNVSYPPISKENFLCRLFFHAFCQFVVITVLALRVGEVGGLFGWNFAFLKFYSHHCLGYIFCFSSQPLSVAGVGLGMLLSNTFNTSSVVSGGISTWFRLLELLFPCCLMETNNSFMAAIFFRHGANQIQICYLCSGQEYPPLCTIIKWQLFFNLEPQTVLICCSSVLHLKKWSLISLLHLSLHLTCNTCMLFSPSVTMRTINR